MASDLELLRNYARNNAEECFTALVGRHLNLVYSTALRQLRSPQLAEEVAQSAFTDLARNARRFAPDTILTAWLYQVTRRTAIDVVRREARRRSREQIATEVNAVSAAATEWTRIEPLLDEAMDALDDIDRTAVLLRYFENKSLREVGHTLGTSEDAAQKRVSRAVERLRAFFSKRGVTTGASGLVLFISANAVQSAPVGLAAAIAAAAVPAGAGVSASTASFATKTIAMTTMQKTIIGAALAAALGTGMFEACQASRLRNRVQSLQQRQEPLAEQIQKLLQERGELTNKVNALLADNERLNRNTAEILKLRGEVARLRPLRNAVATLQRMATQSALALAQWKPEELANVGRSTPLDALQTYLWSAVTTNVSELARCLTPDDSDPPTEDTIRRFVEDARIHPDKSALEFKAVSQTVVSPDEVLLGMSALLSGNGGIIKTLTLRNVNGEWKLVLFNERHEGAVTYGANFGTQTPWP
ncbi:MAG: RNA polymerase sigma factor [Limisphaerales bacterium]